MTTMFVESLTLLEAQYAGMNVRRARLIAAIAHLRGPAAAPPLLDLHDSIALLERQLLAEDERGDRLLGAIASLKGNSDQPATSTLATTNATPPKEGSPRPTDALSVTEMTVLTALSPTRASLNVLRNATRLSSDDLRRALKSLVQQGHATVTGYTSGRRWRRAP